MNTDHDLDILKLDSQINILSRLQFVSRFGANLIHIQGVKGSGKSWLSQCYLANWCHDAHKALLICDSDQTLSQQREIVLNQLVNDSLPDDSFDSIFVNEKCNLVLVIDDAHLLATELVQELWLLVEKAQLNSNWQVNVLLFSEIGNLKQSLLQISNEQENKPIYIEIEPLTQEEASLFIDRFAANLKEKERIRIVTEESQRLPGILIALGNKKMKGKTSTRSIIQSPVSISIFILLLVIGLTYWFMEVGVSSKNASDSGNVVVNKKENIEDPMPSDLKLHDDTYAIPGDVIDAPVVTESEHDNKERIVIPSSLVDTLVEDKNENKERIVKGENNKKEQGNVSPSIQDESKTDINNKAVKAKPINNTANELFPLANNILKERSTKNYVLQLGAMTRKKDVKPFLEQYDLDDSIYVYQTVRNGVTWFIITYGDYESILDAHNAIDTLPGSVQSLGPWIKSVSDIQNELKTN